MRQRSRHITFVGLALLALSACATTPPEPPAVSGAAEASAPEAVTASRGATRPATGGRLDTSAWIAYRDILMRPDPEHRTLEAEPLPYPGVTRPPEPEADTAPAEPPDLWQRIRAGHAFPAQPPSPRLEAELRWYVSHPEYLDRTIERGRPYLRLIVDALAERDMPLEIAFLPIVESAFQPFAYSHGQAAGLWQFVPGTARRFGLKQTWWYDGRRDVVASTRAALDYLEYLHGFFDGDWMLALAAYNSGEGTVRRAVQRNRERGRPTDFWALELPRETRAYVPKLVALSWIFADPDAYDIELPALADEPMVTQVETGSQIDLARVAELAGLDLDKLYRLNPAFNRWATDPDGPHDLLLPVAAAERFISALADLPASQRVSWLRHRVSEGETLGGIAAHHGTTVAVLRQANGISGHMIRIGQNLVVPVAIADEKMYALSADQRREALHARAGADRIVHVVRTGDTLWDIARLHGTTVRQLARWNAMAPADPLRPGQRLVIRGSSTVAGGPLQNAHPLSREATQRIQYVVRRGDSLSRISQRFGVTVADLIRWNTLAPDKYLQPGQRLTLFVDVTRMTANL